MMKSLFNTQLKLKLKIKKEKILSRLFNKTTNIRDSWADTPKDYTDMVDFLNWFDQTGSIDETLKKSTEQWNYFFKAFPYFKDLKKEVCLEIGFGGGRLIARAAQDFKTAMGVDIHNAFVMSEKFLKSQNIHNYKLISRNHLSSAADQSVDFIYSFIVFQHFDSLDEVQFYLNQIRRLLKPNGIAHIYFGKSKTEDVQVTEQSEFTLRDCSLFIKPSEMRKLIEKDFKIIDFKDSLPRNSSTGEGESVQACVVFTKN